MFATTSEKIQGVIHFFCFLLMFDNADRPSTNIGEERKRELTPPMADLSGIYQVSGSEGAKTYQGAATIKKVGEVYVVTWAMENNAQGVGIRVGDTFSVGWSQMDAKGSAVTVYTISPGPVLRGRWASIPGNGQTHQETLKFIKPFERE